MTSPFIPQAAPPVDPMFADPSSVDYNARLGVGSDVDRQEWDLRKQRMRELLDNIKARQDLTTKLTGAVPEPAAVADTLVNRAATPPLADPEVDHMERNKLFGAAQYYGIEGYDKIPLEALQKIVNAKRLGVQHPTGDLPFMQGVEVAGRLLGAGAADAFIGTVESLSGLAKKVPFLRDHLNERRDWDKMTQNLAKFSEEMNNEMSPAQQERARTVEGVGHAIGASIIAWPLWNVAGAVGGGPGLAMYGARMSAIERAVIQGTSVAALMRGGRPAGGPADETGMTPRDKEIAMGGAFAGIVTAIAPALGQLASKVKNSFPFKNRMGYEGPPTANAEPWAEPQTVDAEWHFVDDTQRLLGSGAPRPGAAVAEAGPPRAPTSLADDLPPGIAEFAPPEVQARIAATNPPRELAVGGDRRATVRPGLDRRAEVRQNPADMTPEQRGAAIDHLTTANQRLSIYAAHPNAPEDVPVFRARIARQQAEIEALEAAGPNSAKDTREMHQRAVDFVNRWERDYGAARADGASLTKQATILESPAVMEMARQPVFDDADVVRAALTSEPSAAHVVQGVGNISTALQKMVQAGVMPGAMRPVTRTLNGVERTDLIVSNGKPITNEMVQEYEQTGLYSGMQVTHGPAGIEGELVSINPVRAIIRAGGADLVVPTNSVLPGRGSVPARPDEIGINNAPQIYQDFKAAVLEEFNTEAVSAGIGPKDWLSPEVASVLPHRMQEFFDKAGLNPVERHSLDAYINQERVIDYQLSAPEEFAGMQEALSRVMEAYHAAPIADGFTAEIHTDWLKNGPQQGPLDPSGRLSDFHQSGPSTYDLAETRGFIWQNHPDMPSGVLLDLNSGEVFPMPHEGAANEFLTNVNRAVPDHTPASDVPMEIATPPIGGANPGKTTQGPLDSKSIVESFSEHELALEDELTQLIADDAAAAIPSHPAVVNDAVLSIPSRSPAPPSGGSPPVPPRQPPPSPPGGAFGEGDPLLREGRPETLGDQFARAVRVNPKNVEEVGNMYDSVILRFLNPMRSMSMRMTPWLEELGINARNLWADGQGLYEGRVRSHNDAHPWMERARGIFNQLPAGLVRNGTVTRLAEIADFNQRIGEMNRLGFNDKQINAVNQLEAFNNDFFEREMVGSMGFNPHQRIFGYMSRVRAKQADPRFTGDPYEDVGNHLGPYSWYAEHARVGGLDFREMNAEILTDHMVRSAMFEKHIAPVWNSMREAWSDPRIPTKHAEPILEWLDVVRTGYNPKYQIAIQGVRQVLNSFKIPATDRDVQRLWNFAFRNTYRSALGWRPHVFFRDSIQPLFAWTRFGNMPEFAGVYTDIITSGPARQAMLNRAYQGGWIEKGRVRVAVSEAFDPVLNPAGVDQSGSKLRKDMTEVVDYIHDRMPDRFKGGIQGTHADPMHIYGQKLGTLNRLVTGETGWRVASKAIAKYNAGEMTMPELLGESGARRSKPVIRDHFQRLVEQGRTDEAANVIAHEWADTQFRGGIAEIPMGNRSLAGRVITMMGNFSIGYVNQLSEGLTAGNTSDKVKFGLRYATIMLALNEIEERSKWKGFQSWQWHTSLLFAGGPLATFGALKLVTGMGARLMDRQPTPDQSRELRETFGPDSPKSDPWHEFPRNQNPAAGALNTVEGLQGALSGASPTEDAARFLITGDRRGQGAGPAFRRWYEGLELQAANRPALDPHFGRPMPSASLVAPSTPPPQAPADSVTMGAPAPPLAGETYDGYRRRVLAKTSWSPDTAAIRNLNSLRPEVREPLKEMMKAAAAEGIQLDVAETGRTQERQEMLFQKGRSQPGPQVTWTLNSDHKGGRAADLVSPTPGGYMWIQQNASRFGFRTLGPTDPGHVYVPSQNQVSGGVKSFLDSLLKAPPTSGGGAMQ